MNDDAVSPLIGTILLVAISVILASVVGAYAFGMVGGQQQPHNVAVKAEVSGTDIQMVYYGGDGDGALDKINVTIRGTAQASWTPAEVGEMHTFVGPYASPVMVQAIAVYKEGTQYVIFNKEI